MPDVKVKTTYTLAEETVRVAGKGTYECNACGRDTYVENDGSETDTQLMQTLIEHIRYDHASPADLVKVTYTVVLSKGVE